MKQKLLLSLLLAASLVLTGCELSQTQEVSSDAAASVPSAAEVSDVSEAPTDEPMSLPDESDISSEISSDAPSDISSEETPSSTPAPTATPAPTPEPTKPPVPVNCDPQEGEGEAVFACKGANASVTGNGYAVAPGNVIYLLRAGEYTFSGTWNGRIVVNAPELADVQINLNGFTGTCTNNAVIEVLSADDVKISSKNGTVNTLRDTDSSVEKATNTRCKAAVYARSSLEFSGAGKLTVSSDYKHAAAATKKLTVSNSTLTLLAADCGLKGNNAVFLTGGNITIKSNGDGIRTENVTNSDKGNIDVKDCVLSITAAGDGINATRFFNMENATVTVTTLGADISDNRSTGSSSVTPGSKNNHNVTNSTSAKGIKAGSAEANLGALVTINGGTLTVTSTGHAIHSTGSININPGSKVTVSTDKKGLQTHGELTVRTGSTVTVSKSVEGFESEGDMKLAGGNVTIFASDDGISIRSASRKLIVSGGTVDITVTGGETDGIDSTGGIQVTGGTVISRCAGNFGIDAGTDIVVTKGTVIAIGGISKTPGGSTTCFTAVMDGKALSAGDYTLTCGTKKTAFTLTGSYTSCWVCSDAMKDGTACTLAKGGTAVASWTQSGKTQNVN